MSTFWSWYVSVLTIGTLLALLWLVFATRKDAVDAKFQDMKIEVPLLTMLPIPFIRVEEATIDFNAKINSIETQSQSSDLAIGGNLEVKRPTAQLMPSMAKSGRLLHTLR